MIKKQFSRLLLTLFLLGLLSFSTDQPVQSRQRLILDILMEGLTASHYSPMNIDDNFSEKLFDLYLKRLDFNKKFLLESDINQLSVYRKKIDDEIRNGTFEMFLMSNQLISKRILEREMICREILAKPFNYETTEEFETDADKIPFCKSEQQLKEEWRKSLQLDRKSTRLNSSHSQQSRMPSSA